MTAFDGEENISSSICTSENLSSEDENVQHLVDKCEIFIGVGSKTTAETLSITTLCIPLCQI